MSIESIVDILKNEYDQRNIQYKEIGELTDTGFNTFNHFVKSKNINLKTLGKFCDFFGYELVLKKKNVS